MRQKIFREKTKNISLGKSQIRKKGRKEKQQQQQQQAIWPNAMGDVETHCGEPRPRHLSPPPPFRVYIEGGLNRRRSAKHVSFSLSLWIEKRYLVFTSFEILRDRDWPL
jgi:hypothetical protein